jgi:hypothetical protein
MISSRKETDFFKIFAYTFQRNTYDFQIFWDWGFVIGYLGFGDSGIRYWLFGIG